MENDGLIKVVQRGIGRGATKYNVQVILDELAKQRGIVKTDPIQDILGVPNIPQPIVKIDSIAKTVVDSVIGLTAIIEDLQRQNDKLSQENQCLTNKLSKIIEVAQKNE